MKLVEPVVLISVPARPIHLRSTALLLFFSLPFLVRAFINNRRRLLLPIYTQLIQTHILERRSYLLGLLIRNHFTIIITIDLIIALRQVRVIERVAADIALVIAVHFGAAARQASGTSMLTASKHYGTCILFHRHWQRGTIQIAASSTVQSFGRRTLSTADRRVLVIKTRPAARDWKLLGPDMFDDFGLWIRNDTYSDATVFAFLDVWVVTLGGHDLVQVARGGDVDLQDVRLRGEVMSALVLIIRRLHIWNSGVVNCRAIMHEYRCSRIERRGTDIG